LIRSFIYARFRELKVPLASHIPRAVFGVTLDEALEVAEIDNLPAIVYRCIQYLELKKADQEEGIYRLSGSSAVIKNLKDRFNNGAPLLPSQPLVILTIASRGRCGPTQSR